MRSEFPPPKRGFLRSEGIDGSVWLSSSMVVGGCASKHPSKHRSKHHGGVLISDHYVSLFEPSERAESYRAQLLDFMETHVYPAERVYEIQMRESGNLHHHPQIIEDLKGEARRRGL